MATSQLRLYTSADPDGPGPLNGLTGSLIALIDACLVNGYTDHPAAGWQKFDSGYTGPSASISAYTNVSGSGNTLYVNDAGFSGPGAAGREAVVWGYERLTGLTSSTVPLFTSSSGTGFGRFGGGYWRKSNTADTTVRNWFMFADAYTMYLFTITGDSGNSGFNGSYHTNIFGDIFSLKGSSDAGRSIIVHQNVVNSGVWWNGTTVNDVFDVVYFGAASVGAAPFSAPSLFAQPGHYMARSYNGLPGGVQVCKYPADMSRTYVAITNWVDGGNARYIDYYPFGGTLPSPNPTDNSIYMSPLCIGETDGTFRGRLRGCYVLAHPQSMFGEGQVFQGTGDYAGKTFKILKGIGYFGFIAVEISPTVETND